MQLQVWCVTDRGLKRESNQDSFLIDSRLGLFVVADGMGGHSGGEVASSMAVETVQDIISQYMGRTDSPKDILRRAYSEASMRIYNKSLAESPRLTGMGTTMVLALYREPNLFVANVGDSRAYMYRAPHLWQVTEDHSLINEQIRAGLLNEEQARHFAGRNVITRSVGYERDVECDIIEREVMPGEYYLLCSDGLTSMVSNEKISEIIEKNPAQTVADKCVIEAKLNGGDDNVTTMVLYFKP